MNSLGDRLFNESKTKEGQFDSALFFEKVDEELIRRGNTDIMLQKIARKLMSEIKETQSLSKTQELFRTVEKIEDPIYKNGILAEAFESFSQDFKSQWISLSIAKKVSQYKDNYLYQLIEACRKTKNKEIALEAAEEISDAQRKAKYLAQIKYQSNFFK